MKAIDKPQISKKWWTSEKPSDVKGAELEKALSAVEKVLADASKGDARSVDACITALEDLRAAADKTIKKELDKKKHKDQIGVLEKFDDVIKSEIKRLEAAKASSAMGANGDVDEEDEDENKLFDKNYLYKMVKLLKSGGTELRFGFGVDTNAPEASALLLKRKGKPEQLFKALKKSGRFSNRVMTYGTAVADPQDGKTLVFRLADGASEPPQILKAGRKFLRSDKSLRFRKLKLVLPGGQQLIDNEPDDDVNAGDLAQELVTLQSLESAWQQTLLDVSAQIEKLRKALDVQSDPAVRRVGEALGNVMRSFPDLDLSKLVAATKSNDRAAYDRTRAQTAKEIGEVHELLSEGPLLSTIDENPLVKTNVHASVNTVLRRITTELQITA